VAHQLVLTVIGDDRPGLTGEPERISNDLMADITLDETIRA
jgi:predicted amino acid-binding ACT domain protein